MTNSEKAIEVVGGLLLLSINALLATQEFQALVEKARSENRDISDDELSNLRSKNQDLTERVLEKLE